MTVGSHTAVLLLTFLWMTSWSFPAWAQAPGAPDDSAAPIVQLISFGESLGSVDSIAGVFCPAGWLAEPMKVDAEFLDSLRVAAREEISFSCSFTDGLAQTASEGEDHYQRIALLIYWIFVDPSEKPPLTSKQKEVLRRVPEFMGKVVYLLTDASNGFPLPPIFSEVEDWLTDYVQNTMHLALSVALKMAPHGVGDGLEEIEILPGFVFHISPDKDDYTIMLEAFHATRDAATEDSPTEG